MSQSYVQSPNSEIDFASSAPIPACCYCWQISVSDVDFCTLAALIEPSFLSLASSLFHPNTAKLRANFTRENWIKLSCLHNILATYRTMCFAHRIQPHHCDWSSLDTERSNPSIIAVSRANPNTAEKFWAFTLIGSSFNSSNWTYQRSLGLQLIRLSTLSLVAILRPICNRSEADSDRLQIAIMPKLKNTIDH